ncbi:nicotinate-nucleotide--dimethylbenzimidazole phosphoribosyltransferase [Nitritalea halalkaliphila LW7]|uniref:Nicotinate-nucleotide--dimethylbenzimidazole phosphoribosyltransferase n=1 Tax=Nitritalea halalkaliphila LW7 TaxID=1189621 RepID=I5CA96_9BACT|nr:nicotinate-nucleotide--dimethylbenzimidazole phosphoribosyltransferase [Nitritalea halalkaliphila]EIM78748.1 nicotinate-nucleotide--dimethylbenzimidazole phosphoribosyltransferase [Nitritalea halalkaliphila LW7]
MLTKALQEKIDTKTKPIGALGLLEKIAHQIGTIQNTLSPQLQKPTLIVFAGDHGIAAEGVSAYPSAVTYQMVLNFLSGGAAINVFCRQHGLELKIVDAGVQQDFPPHEQLLIAKVGYGTKSFLRDSAMTAAELEQALTQGRAIVQDTAADGCNVIGFGEMGIGNTSAAAMLMHYCTGIPVSKCIGKGTGLNAEQLAHKQARLEEACQFHGPLEDPKQILATFGGFEMAQMCGAMLEAYAQNMLILVDGFIASAVYLVATKLCPEIHTHALFCHQSDEQGHQHLLEYVGGAPILHLNMRLGEGTGCALAYPIIASAVAFLNDMASFQQAGVSDKQ